MFRLEIVKSERDIATRNQEAGMSHGTAVTKRLVDPWAGTDRIVCGDSYFASAETCKVLYGSQVS